MPFQIEFQVRRNYLHATVTGENTLENVAGYLSAIHRECKAGGLKRILVEERLDGPRLSTFEVYQVVTQGSSQAASDFEAIAYVDVNAEGGLMKFAEDIAVNRSAPMQLFPTVAAAQEWLESLPNSSS